MTRKTISPASINVLVDKELFLVRIHCTEELLEQYIWAAFYTLGKIGTVDQALMYSSF